MGGSTSKEIEAPDNAACWALLDRVGASPQLRRAPRLREFLFYVAQRSLRDGCGHIHEHEIGVDVFGRPDVYDTSVDNIVRANATELRKRLEAYFEAEGRHEAVVIDIPRGSYVPVFRNRPVSAEVEDPLDATAQPPEMPTVPKEVLPTPVHRWHTAIWIAALVVLAGACIVLWARNRAMKRLLYPWKDEPAVAALWSQLVDSSRATDVVVADQSFLLIQNIDKHPFSLDDYLTRDYININNSSGQKLNPDRQMLINLLGSKTMGSMGEFRLAERILALDPRGQNVHLYNAREYMSPLLARDNVILIGSSFSNPWQALFESRLNFIEEPNSDHMSPIANRAPRPGEQSIYATESDPLGYCIVAYLPSPNHIGKVLLIGGTSAEATEAGGDFLLSEDQLSDFQKKLHAVKLPYFEVLLKTSQARDTPFATTIAAYRTYPDLN
jgi:hypothetical protein